MKRNISLRSAILLAVMVAAVTFAVTMFFSQDIYDRVVTNGSTKARIYQKVNSIYNTVRDNYLYDFDEETLMDYVGRGMVAALDDQYGAYYSKEEYQVKSDSDKGHFAGIGMQVKQDQETNFITVQTVYPNSLAEKAGLQKGDVITDIDGENLAELDSTESTKLLRGEKGTTVVLRVERDGITTEYSIVRDDVEVPCIQSRMIGTKGYVKILDFTGTTFAQFKKAIEDLQAAGADGLVFDLRENGGGTLDSVLDMLDYLLPEGELGSTVNKSGKKNVLKTSDADEIDLPMVTLTNENTASASELFVMALKDYEKAPSVGTKTYGKGVMQVSFGLRGDTAIKITTDYFNPPKSENFNGKGIEPDYEVTLTEEQRAILDELDENTDPQLKQALTVLEK